MTSYCLHTFSYLVRFMGSVFKIARHTREGPGFAACSLQPRRRQDKCSSYPHRQLPPPFVSAWSQMAPPAASMQPQLPMARRRQRTRMPDHRCHIKTVGCAAASVAASVAASARRRRCKAAMALPARSHRLLLQPLMSLPAAACARQPEPHSAILSELPGGSGSSGLQGEPSCRVAANECRSPGCLDVTAAGRGCQLPAVIRARRPRQSAAAAPPPPPASAE